MPEDVPTLDEFHALVARVEALEAGGSTHPPDGGESPDGTSVTGPGPTITDSLAIVWDLVDSGSKGLQVRRAGTIDNITYHVLELAYHSHVVLHRSADGWYSWSDASGSWSNAPAP